MDSSKIERESDDDHCPESDMLSISDTSSQDDNCRNRGTEPKNKMKLRSFKLSRLPSLRSCVRPMKSPSSKCPSMFSGYAASSEQSTPVVISDSSPNYSQAKSCSDARKESFQKPGGIFTRRSSFKAMKSLAKMSSMKFRRPLMRKSSGGTDLKKLKKTISIKPASSESLRPSTRKHARCDQREDDTSARYSNLQFQASPRNSESSSSGNDQNKESLNIVRPISDSSVRAFKRTITLRPKRILTKTASLKSKRSSMKKGSEVSEVSNPSIVRATCSSTLKDAKFPRSDELQPGGSESGGVSAMKICTYSYCSLHGHRHGSHGNLPPLKQFVSMRRRSLKTQKSMKPEIHSVPKVKSSRSRRKGAQTRLMIFNGDSADQEETAQARIEKSSVTEKVFKVESKIPDGHGRENMNIGDSANLSEILLCETSNPRPEPKAFKQCDNLFLKHDGVLSTGPEEANAKVHKDLNGDTVSHLNLGSKGNIVLNIEVSEIITLTKATNEEKPEASEPDNDFQERFSQSGDSTVNCPTNQSQKTPLGKQKYIRLWGLIYRHMASGIATEDETGLPYDGKNKAEQVKDRCTMLQMNGSVSCQSSSGTDDGMDGGDQNAGEQKFETWQSDAIKLVQEAFDKILSEIPDQSSNDQTITSDITSEKELWENNKSESGQQSISSYCNSTKGSTARDPEEPPLEAAKIKTSGEEKAASKMGNKSSPQISKNWSNLKKVIILRRFVKALEKVNKFNPHKAQSLPIEADPETEKVHLRHQTVEERKNADEWMLDFAIQRVISKLAPAQKRKVALLVQAFETVTPLPEISTHLRSNATFSSHGTPRQECTDCFIQTGDRNESVSLHKASYPERSIKDATIDQVGSFLTAESHVSGTCSELQERTQTKLKEEEKETVSFNLVNGETNSILSDDQPGFNDVTSTNREVLRLSGNSDKFETGNILNAAGEQSCRPESLSPETFVESTAVSCMVSSASFSEPLEEARAICREQASTKYEVLQKSSPLEESEYSDTIDMAQESKLEKQKYMRLWYLLYKHMVSGSTEARTQPIHEDSQKEEQGSDDNALLGIKDVDSCKDFSQMNQILDDQNTSCQKIYCDQNEAIKIIEEAIDEIPLPDIQDDSLDDPPITDNLIPAQELQKKHSEVGEPVIYTSTNSSKDSFRESNNREVENDMILDSRETRLNSDNIPALEEPEAFPMSVTKSKPQVQKNWSNLKKVILLRRFIKSLEKVRKFNPREPRYLPLEPAKGAEKVHLRHQNKEDKKNTDDWMLDHALQQVVAKLTPARKRKVELLVEAFETVTPMLEVKAGQRHRAALSPQPRLINA